MSYYERGRRICGRHMNSSVAEQHKETTEKEMRVSSPSTQQSESVSRVAHLSRSSRSPSPTLPLTAILARGRRGCSSRGDVGAPLNQKNKSYLREDILYREDPTGEFEMGNNAVLSQLTVA